MPADQTEAFEHYRILRRPDGSLHELGHGAMGVTYKAIDDNLHKIVALKVINSTHLDSARARDRFIREARAAASITHRNVAAVHHFGHNAQSYFYSMEFIDGETVEALVKRIGPLLWREALGIVLQAARALMAAHEKRHVHRDLKPANLMLTPEAGEDALVVKVIDFGLVKSLAEDNETVVNLSKTGFVGTPAYASPEQCNEETPDIRSDIYSLGATLWYMLAGAPPFTGSVGVVFAKHLTAPPPWENLPAGLPEPVRALLARMLAKERDDRPTTPADLRRDLEACLREPPPPPPVPVVTRPLPSPSPAVVPPPPTPPKTAPGRRPALWPLVALLTASGTAGVWYSRQTRAPAAHPTPAAAPTVRPIPEETALPRANVPPAPTPTLTSTPRDRLSQAKAWIVTAREQADSLSDTGYNGKASALAAVAGAQALAGDVAGSRSTLAAALKTAQTMEDGDEKIKALQNISAAQANVPDPTASRQTFAAVLQIAAGIKDALARAQALGAIAGAQARAGDTVGSRQTFAAALQAAASIKDEYFRSYPRLLIAEAQARAGDTVAALQTAEIVATWDACRAQALSAIADAQALAGETTASRQTLAAALKGAEEADEADELRARMLSAFADAQSRAGDAAGSRQTLATALETAGSVKDGFYKANALRKIAETQSRAGDTATSRQTFAAARQAAEGIKDDGLFKTGALSDIAVAQARAGEVAAARQTAEGIKDNTFRPAALRAIATAQAGAGDSAAAETTLAALSPGKDRCLGYASAAQALLDGPAEPDDD